MVEFPGFADSSAFEAYAIELASFFSGHFGGAVGVGGATTGRTPFADLTDQWVILRAIGGLIHLDAGATARLKADYVEYPLIEGRHLLNQYHSQIHALLVKLDAPGVIQIG